MVPFSHQHTCMGIGVFISFLMSIGCALQIHMFGNNHAVNPRVGQAPSSITAFSIFRDGNMLKFSDLHPRGLMKPLVRFLQLHDEDLGIKGCTLVYYDWRLKYILTCELWACSYRCVSCRYACADRNRICRRTCLDVRRSCQPSKDIVA